jgi:hypothetical protein
LTDHGYDDDAFEDASTVRPYTVTGGRTRPNSESLPIEALVRATAAAGPTCSPEERRILDLTANQYLSIAEVSAHTKLPVGVVRVLVGDLADADLVRIDGLTANESAYNPASTLSVLESVLNGISAL